MYLVDTNVLLRFVDSSSRYHDVARNAILFIQQEQQTLWISSQNCIEFWNVLTRPKQNNGFGFSPAMDSQGLEHIERLFTIVTDSGSTYYQWRKIVLQYGVSGVQVHDARLVATMLVHKLTHILTFNSKDFIRYTSITAVDPTQLQVNKSYDQS